MASLMDMVNAAKVRFANDVSSFSLVKRNKQGQLVVDHRSSRKLSGIAAALKKGGDVVYVPYYGLVGKRADVMALASELNLDLSDKFLIDVNHGMDHTVHTHLGAVIVKEFLAAHARKRSSRSPRKSRTLGEYLSLHDGCISANPSLRRTRVTSKKSKKSSRKTRGPRTLADRIKAIKSGKVVNITNLRRENGRLVGLKSINKPKTGHRYLHRVSGRLYVDVREKYLKQSMHAVALLVEETGYKVDLEALRQAATEATMPATKKRTTRKTRSSKKSRSPSKSRSSSRKRSSSAKKRSSSKKSRSPSKSRSRSPAKKATKKRSSSSKKSSSKKSRSPSKSRSRSPAKKATKKRASPAKKNSKKTRSPSPAKKATKKSPSRSPSRSPAKRNTKGMSPRKASPTRHVSPAKTPVTTPLTNPSPAKVASTKPVKTKAVRARIPSGKTTLASSE